MRLAKFEKLCGINFCDFCQKSQKLIPQKLIPHELIPQKIITLGYPITLLCLIIGGGGEIALFCPQCHFIMNPILRIVEKKIGDQEKLYKIPSFLSIFCHILL